MYCKNCGAVISENEKICLTCGAEISNDEIATENTAVSEDAVASQKKSLLAVILSIASFFSTIIFGTTIGLPFSIVSLILSIKDFKKNKLKLESTIALCFSAGTVAYCVVAIISSIIAIGMLIFVYAFAIIGALLSAMMAM